MFKKIMCYLNLHKWYQIGNRRACTRCTLRQVRIFYGNTECWNDHTYPLDADKFLDPTPIGRDKFSIGFETLWKQMWEQVQAKKSIDYGHDWCEKMGRCWKCKLYKWDWEMNKTHCSGAKK